MQRREEKTTGPADGQNGQGQEQDLLSAVAQASQMHVFSPPQQRPMSPEIFTRPHNTCCCCLAFIMKIFSRLTFSWLFSFLWIGSKRQLTPEDLVKPVAADSAQVCAGQLRSAWRHEAARSNSSSGVSGTLGRAYRRAFGCKYLTIGLVLRPLWASVVVAQILCVRQLVQFVENGGRDDEKGGAAIAVAILATGCFCQPILINSLFLWSYRMGLRARAATTTLIWEKVQRLSLRALHGERGASIINLAEVDTVRIAEGFRYAHFAWAGILELVLVAIMISIEAGPAALLGILVLAIAIPIQVFFGKKVGEVQHAAVKATDARARIMQEILTGIQLVKVNAWEPPFASRVRKARNIEVSRLRHSEVLKSLNGSIFQAAPLVSAACVFAVTSMVEGKPLTPASAFAVLAWLNLIMRTLIMVPRGVQHFVEARVSARRISTFLAQSEEVEKLEELVNPDLDAEGVAIKVTGASWSWLPDTTGNSVPPTLQDISFDVKSSELMVVLGPIGSGKSSLLSALQGELERRNGEVQFSSSAMSSEQQVRRPRLLYVPQAAFITNSSLVENICFGLPFHEERLKRVTAACGLDPDIAQFRDGLRTMIGEAGVTLSGGQKQRVALARAVYAADDADLILCDDVLSALDSKVAAHVFKHVLSRSTGLLANTPTILVTHAEWCAEQANSKLLLEDGRMVAFERTEVHARAVELQSGVPEVAEADITMAQAVESKLQGSLPVQPQPSNSQVHQVVASEGMQVGTVTSHTWLSYVHAGGGACYFAFLIGLFVLTQTTRLACDYWIAQWSTRSFDSSISTGGYLGIYFGIVAVFTLLLFIRTLRFMFAMLRASTVLHNGMFNHVMHAPMQWFWSQPTGRILNRFTRDVDNVDRLMTKSAQDWLNFQFIAIGAIASMVTVVPHLLIIVVPVIVAFVFFARFYAKTSRQLKRLAGSTRSPIYHRLGELMAGLGVFRSHHLETKLQSPFVDCLDTNVSSEFLFEVSSRWLGIRLDLLNAATNTVLALITYFAASSFDAGLIGVALVQSLQLSGVLQYSIRQAAAVESLMTSVERVSAYSKLQPEKESSDPLDCPEDWPHAGKIEIQNLQLRYHDELPLVLQGVSLQVRPGEMVGVIGRTGSGKSSLLSAFFRLVQPCGGSIEIDGINALRMRLPQLRRNLTIMTQETTLFNGSLRSNIDPFNEYSDEKVWQVLDLCHLRTQLNSEGLEMFVADGGNNFSAGERQLIVMARALLQKPKLLLMDEASSNIDLETDRVIQQMLRDNFQSCTKLIIAHRLDTIIDADRILVLDSGEVVEFDKPGVLIQNPESHFLAMIHATGEENARLLLDTIRSSGTPAAEAKKSECVASAPENVDELQSAPGS